MMSEKYNKIGVDKKNLSNIIRDSYVVALLLGGALYLLKAHLPEQFAGGFTYGAICSATNLYLLNIFIRVTITPDRIKVMHATAAGIGQLAVLTVFLYGFSKHWFSDAAMVTGFTFSLIFMMAMILYRRKADSKEQERL